MGKELYFTPARRKIGTVHIWTDTGAKSAAIKINEHDSGSISLIIEAKDINQGAAALNAFINEQLTQRQAKEILYTGAGGVSI